MPDQKIILDVFSVLNSEIGTSQSFPIKERIKNFDKEVRVVDVLEGTITINHFEESQLASFFNLKTVLEIVCARCLKKFKTDLILNYEQTFSVKPAEDEFPILSNKTIDVFPSIRQEILLSLPIKPICNKKCKGVKTNIERQYGSTQKENNKS